MRWGTLCRPWRALRHSLFVSGLSLAIASSAIVVGVIVQQPEEPSFPKASASSSMVGRGESSSLGVLTKFVKEAAAPRSEANAAATSAGTQAPTEAATEAQTEVAAVEGVAAPAVEGTTAPASSEARIASALSNAAPALAERPAEQAQFVVSSARFKTRSGATASEAAVRTQAPAPTLPNLQPGETLTVPLTFYYCEDSTSGQRRGDGGGFCGVMRDGTNVYPGAAACSYSYLGQRFRIEGDPTGRIYTCNDTGSGIHGQHRDIWFMSSGEGWAWQAVVGRSAVIQVLQ